VESSNKNWLYSLATAILSAAVILWGYAYFRWHGHAGLNIFIGGVVTLAVYSILYRENPFYRLAEHIYLGLAAGYGVVIIWRDVLSTQWFDPIVHDGQWLWLWVLPLAVMTYFVFSRKHGWISRIPLVMLSGAYSGMVFQAYISQYFPQIRDSFRSVVPNVITLANPNPDPKLGLVSISGAINNGIFLITMLCVITYFFFSFEQKHKAVRGTAQAGRWIMMIGFGAIFGSTIMTRFALLVDRVYFLLIEWLKMGKPMA